MSTAILAVSRRTRRTPFTERVEAQGVKGYTVYNHMLLPTAFRSMEEDYWHLCRYVQIWDVACERQVELRGPDAARLAQMMTPRDLSRAAVGQCLYAPLVDETASMINDPVLLKLAEDRFWLSIADSDVLLWAKGLAYGLGLDVVVDEPDIFPLAVQGPKADDLMAVLFGDTVRRIRFFRFARLPFKGRELVVARSGWSKQGGFEIYLDDAALGGDLWDALWQAGAPLGVGAGCPNLIERVEGGLLSYGNDMTRDNNPLECGLDRYCRLDGAIEFMGRDALVRIRDAGVARQIRGIRFEGDPCPSCISPWPVTTAGGPVGQVTTAVWSPRYAANLAFAMLDRTAWAPGQQVRVDCPDGSVRQGTVTLLPFTVSPP